MTELKEVNIGISVVLGSTTMPIHQLLRMGRGAVIALDAGEDDQVVILANDLPVAKGRVILCDDKIGVEVSRTLNKAELRTMG
ncbi:MAG: flagellar motor switch protein FliN [Hyphomicrobiales bacterium]|nr:flagellar motor switch protein FliN [Hyphomicrobiales bacterium]